MSILNTYGEIPDVATVKITRLLVVTKLGKKHTDDELDQELFNMSFEEVNTDATAIY